MSDEARIPRWDLSEYFSGLDSVEFGSAWDSLESQLRNLEHRFDEVGIGTTDFDSSRLDAFDVATLSLNEAMDELRFLATYVNCFVDTDSHDELARRRQSEFDSLRVRMSKLRSRWVRWVGGMDLDRLHREAREAVGHQFAIKKAKILAAHQMSAEEEDLALEMQVDGSMAWEKLYNTATSQLQVQFHYGGDTRTMPMSAIRNLAYDADPIKREAAYAAEIESWSGVAPTIAAALNGIKGEFLTLSARRGWEDPLDLALLNAHIDRETLNAMMGAARESFPAFRRYLHAKSKRLGYEGALPWHGLFAPIAQDESSTWPYEKAMSFIVRSFESYSDELAAFAKEAFDRDWVDAEPRSGKADGGYCSMTKDGDSRIFMNYKPSFGSVSTLAHELGHAYHNRMLREHPPLMRQTPMTLAETASIFCETIIRKAGTKSGTDAERLAILEASIMGSCQIVVDISSRFLFEESVFRARCEREIGVTELRAMMTEAQRATYGNGLRDDALHPYMWAAKPHYYDGGYCYYNYPYMFGLLFGLGLYAVYEAEPNGFHVRYDQLLASTGLADAATCAAWFGIDIRSQAFWKGSLSVIERDIEEFVALVG